jgi:alpha-tubulin suppressor-like RCC1 family protein
MLGSFFVISYLAALSAVASKIKSVNTNLFNTSRNELPFDACLSGKPDMPSDNFAMADFAKPKRVGVCPNIEVSNGSGSDFHVLRKFCIWILPHFAFFQRSGLLIGLSLMLAGLCVAPSASAVTPKVAAGGNHTLRIGSNGEFYAWGYNVYGQLGNGQPLQTSTQSTTPVLVSLPAGVTPTAVAAGYAHSLAPGSDGKLYAWGSNGSGQLGNGTTTDASTPVLVSLPAGVTPTAVAAGYAHSLAVGSDGNLYDWGFKGNVQLLNGNGSITPTPTVVSLPIGVTPIAVAAGNSHRMAVGSDGKLYAWGDNSYGQLGKGIGTQSWTPVEVTLPVGITPIAVAAGAIHSLAIGSNGKLYAWGDNYYGQLGNGSTAQSTTPVLVSLPAGVTPTAVAAGNSYSLAVGNDGKLYAWGLNSTGQLGNGTTTMQSTTPVVVSLPSGVAPTVVAAGEMHSLAVGSDGKLYAWGISVHGQLGNGSTTGSRTPVSILLPQTISFGVAPTLIYGGTGTVTATATSGLAVSLASTTPTVCTISGTTVTVIGVGTCTIAANQAGDASYSAAPQVTLQMTTVGLLAITTTNLKPAEFGVLYNDPVAATGGSGPYVYNIANGTSLPPGLDLDVITGNIKGAPKQLGGYTFAIGLTDQSGTYVWSEFYIEVTEKLAFNGASTLKRGTLSKKELWTIEVTGGTQRTDIAQPYFLALTGGSLPPGLQLVNGNIEGAPSAIGPIGPFQFTITATDASGRTVSQAFSMEVVNPLTITTPKLNSGLVGAPYSQTLTATGGYGTRKWSVYQSRLPDGIFLDLATGTLAGTPLTHTSGIVIFSVTDSDGRVALQDYDFAVAKPLKAVTLKLPDGFANALYSEVIRLEGGVGRYTFTTLSLPAGLSLNPSTGILSGNPSKGGGVSLGVTVNDEAWPTPTVLPLVFKLNVNPTMTITSSAVLPIENFNKPINPVVMVAQGGTSPYSWEVIGGYMPEGIVLNAQNGQLTGTPLDQGDFAFTLRATDTNGLKHEKEFYWHISDTLKLTTDVRLPDAAVDVQYSFALSGAGGLPYYSWLLKTGTVPDGLQLTPNGIIKGKPTKKQSLFFTVTLVDNDSPAQQIDKTFYLDVLNILNIYTPSLPGGQVGNAYTATLIASLGSPPHTWRIVEGGSALAPCGLSMVSSDTDATITGNPTAVGTCTFTVEVSDSVGAKATKLFTLEIVDSLLIASSGLKTAIRGVPYSENIAVSGGTLPYVYSVSPYTPGTLVSLPVGLTLNSISGNISGTAAPVTGQSAAFRVKVSDAGTPAVSFEKVFAIQVVDPLTINTQVIPIAQQGAAYVVTLVGNGGVSGYSWTIQPRLGESLPDGLALNPASGLISGTPSGCGNFPFTVNLSDSASVPNNVTYTYVLPVPCSNGKTIQSIAFGALLNQLVTNPPFAISATASSGLPVVFSSTTPNICTIGGNTVTLIVPGTCTIAANQAGNASYAAATQVTQSIAVGSSGQNLNLVTGWNLVGNGVEAPISVATTFNDLTKVATIWKWVSSGTNAAVTYPAWAFYTPSLVDGGQAYAASKGYDFLSTVNAGEGYWVNVKADHSVNVPIASAVKSASFNSSGSRPLPHGWSLIASGDTPTTSFFNNALSSTPPSAGALPVNVTSLWAWDTKATGWYFWAPSLANAGVLGSYLTSKAYLDFSIMPNTPVGTISPTMGFWVNNP